MSLGGIGLINGLALDETFDYDKNVVEDRYAQRQNRDEQRQDGGLLERAVECDYRKDEAEKGCPGVAHKDFGGRLIVAQISKRNANQRNCHNGR